MKSWSIGWVVGAVLMGVTGASWGTVLPDKSLSPPPSRSAMVFVQAEAAYASPGVDSAALKAAAGPAGNGSPGTMPQAAAASRNGTFKLERVNGLSVTDDLKTVYEIKGEPKAVETDPLFKEERVLVYEDCKVGLHNNFVRFIVVSAAEAETVDIDGKTLPLDAVKLQDALGKPDWIAEDGVVYRSHSRALKLFIDAETGKLTAVHYFHRTAA
ncbi:hypothetical protein [Paenibacillus validus]|uniref:hypothetical protein n=1 Tax=Paenibacillus validus TaxID=44253 RepID=UPI003D275FE3